MLTLKDIGRHQSLLLHSVHALLFKMHIVYEGEEELTPKTLLRKIYKWLMLADLDQVKVCTYVPLEIFFRPYHFESSPDFY